jgi:hypothetical protein
MQQSSVRKFVSLPLLLGAILATNLGGQSSAASANLSISPAVQNLVVQQSQQSIDYSVTVTNDGTVPLLVTLSRNDFNALGTNGQLVFTSSAADETDHGLAQRMTFAADSFALAGHESKKLIVTLNDLVTMKPGGHYGAVLFKTRPLSATPQSDGHVTLNQSVASLVFVTTNGTGQYGLQLQSIHSATAVVTLPERYDLVFRNTGNIQTAARGYLVVTDPFNRSVARAIVNPDSALVLPNTNRLLSTMSTTTSHAFWPGIYTVHAYYKYDNASNYNVQTSHFIFLNAAVVGPILIGVTVTMYVLFRFRKQLVIRIKKRAFLRPRLWR